LLVEAQARRAAVTGPINFSAVEVRISGVQQPSLLLLHRDSGVSRGVAREGNEQQLGGESTQLPRAFEAEPTFPSRLVELPVVDLLPLDRTITPVRDEAARGSCRVH